MALNGLRLVLTCWATVAVVGNPACSASAAAEGPVEQPRLLVTSVGQFRNVFGADYVLECDFRLSGVITLVDTNRSLAVLQDADGPVALHFAQNAPALQVGQSVRLHGTRCTPYFARFPDYPYRPTGREVMPSFQAPADWGNYYLTRMRGILRPPVTGYYSFWIASDNSSELWLSTDASPSRIRKLAFMGRFAWSNPGEWTRFPSQHAEPVFLQAGESYYIEALHEQSHGGSHLAVAWEGPSISRSVIPGTYLTPWQEPGWPAGPTNGILREYWTNYCAADLAGIAGPRPFASALTVKEATAEIHGPGTFPQPRPFASAGDWLPHENFVWAQAEGTVRFVSSADNNALLELFTGRESIQVRVANWNPDLAARLANADVRVEGVCERVLDARGLPVPGLIWTPSPDAITFIDKIAGPATRIIGETVPEDSSRPQSMQGFYGTRGVVTFNDRVFDKDLIFVQENENAVLVALADRPFKDRLKVGHDVELGGRLDPEKGVPVITPFFVKDLGWRTMPQPSLRSPDMARSENREGLWSEFEGVVRSVRPDATLSIMLRDGPARVWLSQCPTNELHQYVDSRMRARGVLLLTLLDEPVLLVPSRDFAQVEPRDANSSSQSLASISSVLSLGNEAWRSHRIRLNGTVTYADRSSFFMQDSTGAVRVQAPLPGTVSVGDTVEILAFPNSDGRTCTLSDPLVSPLAAKNPVTPLDLQLAEAPSPDKRGTLVRVSALVLDVRSDETTQLLELQESRRVFYASLPAHRGTLPDILPGSRVRVTGVLSEESAGAPLNLESARSERVLSAIHILLRSPQDVTLLDGPPMVDMEKAAALVGALLATILGTLLWVHLLRLRLERQRAARVAFSRRVLERLEDERRRIAVNLHDSLGQSLLVIKNHALLGIERAPEPDALQQRLNEISGAASRAIEEVRQITHGLRPYQLDRLGLTQAIRASISQAAANSSISFATRVEDIDGVFDKDAEIHIYRIVQEAVTNILRHSRATEATVVIKKKTSDISISIRDNGCGFDPETRSAGASDLGFGLSGIAERVQILGGTLAIDSSPGQGSTLTIEVPLPSHAYDAGRNNGSNRR